VTPRLRRRVEADFPGSTEAVPLVEAVGDTERVQAAVVLAARGDLDELRAMADLARLDRRDALVAGDLADAGWERRLDAVLGT
jgi:hypothetical protein